MSSLFRFRVPLTSPPWCSSVFVSYVGSGPTVVTYLQKNESEALSDLRLLLTGPLFLGPLL